MVAQNQDGQNLTDIRSRNTDELEPSNVWKSKEINEPSQLRSLRLPDNLLVVRIARLMYANSGGTILALAYNIVHKLWKWQKTEQNITGNATTLPPHLWQPSSGILMTTDIRDAGPCFALSKNNSYVMSASGGKVSLFNLATFKTMTTFIHPPPAATCLKTKHLSNLTSVNTMQQDHIDRIIKEHGQLRQYTTAQHEFLVQQTQDMNEMKKLFQQIQGLVSGLSVPEHLLSTVQPPPPPPVIFDDASTTQSFESVHQEHDGAKILTNIVHFIYIFFICQRYFHLVWFIFLRYLCYVFFLLIS